jgi:hypothetical protein
MRPVRGVGALTTFAGSALALLLMVQFAPRSAAQAALSPGQSDYVEHCAGCHGIQGSSAPAPIPVLRDRVGYFLCTKKGRDYLLRLPNVAHVAISDNRELADLMNFVVFGLGGRSAPARAAPYSLSEVADLRNQALPPGTELVRERREIVAELIRQCGAPKDMAVRAE